MKKYKFIIILLMIVTLMMPLSGVAKTKEKVNVYIFKGEGCGYCANAIEFFESIKDEYGKYFNLVEYEVWYNKENSKLMDKVEEYLDIKITGVPFIIVGNDTYPGFIYEWGDDITKSIIQEYNKDLEERKDIIEELLPNTNKNVSNYSSEVYNNIVSILKFEINKVFEFLFNVID